MATISVMDDDAAPLLTLVGAGGELSIDETKFSRSYSVKEPATGRTRVYFLIHFPTTNMRHFDIKYRVTQGANEDFIVGTTTADRTLNPDVQNTMSHGNQVSMNKVYTIGSFEIQNDSTRNIGSITLTLKTGTGYTLSTTPADNSITIDIDAPLLNLVGAGGELAFDETKFSTTYSVSEPTSGTPKVYFLIHFPTTTERNFDIKYRVTQGANEDFIVGTTTADRTLNPTVETAPSHGNLASADTTKIYTIGSFEIQNDSSNNNGEITLTLKAGHGYILSDTAADNSITIDITGTPVIRMVGAGTTNSFTEAHFVNPFTVDEGDINNLTVFFLVYLPATVTSNFMISYSIVERDVSHTNYYLNDDFLGR